MKPSAPNSKTTKLVLEGIARGEEAVRAGRVVSQREAKRRMALWFKEKPTER
jgi:predicted transcriptional regulator